MKKILRNCLILSCAAFMQASFANVESPIGYWKTVDDATGKGKAILRIYENKGALYGQIVKTFPLHPQKSYTLCSACKGDKHNQPIVGMVILEGLKQDKKQAKEWNGGKILDPLNGKIYNCMMTVMSHGEKLNVRGYIGISLFGRSQTWQRVE